MWRTATTRRLMQSTACKAVLVALVCLVITPLNAAGELDELELSLEERLAKAPVSAVSNVPSMPSLHARLQGSTLKHKRVLTILYGGHRRWQSRARPGSDSMSLKQRHELHNPYARHLSDARSPMHDTPHNHPPPANRRRHPAANHLTLEERHLIYSPYVRLQGGHLGSLRVAQHVRKDSNRHAHAYRCGHVRG